MAPLNKWKLINLSKVNSQGSPLRRFVPFITLCHLRPRKTIGHTALLRLSLRCQVYVLGQQINIRQPNNFKNASRPTSRNKFCHSQNCKSKVVNKKFFSAKFYIHMSVHRKYNSKLQPTRCNVSWFIHFYRRSTCFGRFLRPSSGAKNCTYSFRYCQPILLLAAIVDETELHGVHTASDIVIQYCCLLLSWMR